MFITELQSGHVIHAILLFLRQGKYKQAKEAYEQFEKLEGTEPQVKATALKQLGKSSYFTPIICNVCTCWGIISLDNFILSKKKSLIVLLNY